MILHGPDDVIHLYPSRQVADTRETQASCAFSAHHECVCRSVFGSRAPAICNHLHHHGAWIWTCWCVAVLISGVGRQEQGWGGFGGLWQSLGSPMQAGVDSLENILCGHLCTSLETFGDQLWSATFHHDCTRWHMLFILGRIWMDGWRGIPSCMDQLRMMCIQMLDSTGHIIQILLWGAWMDGCHGWICVEWILHHIWGWSWTTFEIFWDVQTTAESLFIQWISGILLHWFCFECFVCDRGISKGACLKHLIISYIRFFLVIPFHSWLFCMILYEMPSQGWLESRLTSRPVTLLSVSPSQNADVGWRPVWVQTVLDKAEMFAKDRVILQYSAHFTCAKRKWFGHVEPWLVSAIRLLPPCISHNIPHLSWINCQPID